MVIASHVTQVHRIRRLEKMTNPEQVSIKQVEGQAELEATEFASGMTLNYHKIELAAASEEGSAKDVDGRFCRGRLVKRTNKVPQEELIKLILTRKTLMKNGRSAPVSG